MLNITSASYTDQGVYQCVAKTEYTVNPSYLVPMVTSTVTTVKIASEYNYMYMYMYTL